MRLPYAKPENYSAFSLQEKVKFIKQCCDERESLWMKLHLNFFGRKQSIYIETIRAISAYMQGYLVNGLDACLNQGIKKYTELSGTPSNRYILDLGTYKKNLLNGRDIEVAYDIINQCFLSNNEFYWFAIRKIDWDQNQTTQPSLAFNMYLSGILVYERQKWISLFPSSKSCDNLPSEKIRPAIKAILTASSGIALATSGVGLTSFAWILIAASFYGISGELSDNIANIFSEQPDMTSPKLTG